MVAWISNDGKFVHDKNGLDLWLSTLTEEKKALVNTNLDKDGKYWDFAMIEDPTFGMHLAVQKESLVPTDEGFVVDSGKATMCRMKMTLPAFPEDFPWNFDNLPVKVGLWVQDKVNDIWFGSYSIPGF